MELSIAALTSVGEPASLAAIARVSKTVDPADTVGISESAILHNDEAYALYRQQPEHVRQTRRSNRENFARMPLTIAGFACAPIVIAEGRANDTSAPANPSSWSAF